MQNLIKDPLPLMLILPKAVLPLTKDGNQRKK
jgi:hypothetical protein